MRKCIPLLLLLLVSCGKQTQYQQMSSYRPSRDILITLDAGHGDSDPGAISDDEKTEEKNLALATTLMTEKHLKRMGYRVLLTRDDDTFVPLTKRSAIANEAKSTIFVSIHYNASSNPNARGVEVYRFRTESGAEEAQALADAILAKVIRYSGAPSRGVKQANFSVLRRTRMPAVLIEGGFVTNTEDLEHLRKTRYLNSIAWGIAQGIQCYFSEQ